MDLSPAMLACVPEGVKRLRGTLLEIPLPDNSVDFAFCVEALEHAIDVDAALAEVRRVLKPGGYLLIIDKNKACLGSRKISEWEQWFTASGLKHGLVAECFSVTTETDIPYNNEPGTDGLFIGWHAKLLA